MVMMNAGFLLSTNALATVCIHPGIPVLMLIGHSGGVGEENAGHATVGSLTKPVLQAMHIVYEKVGRFEDIRPTVRDSQILARSSRRPTAIVLHSGEGRGRSGRCAGGRLGLGGKQVPVRALH